MKIIVLGSGIASGFPGWNEGGESAQRARENDPNTPRREGACLAVSADGQRYSIFEAPLHLASTLTRLKQFCPAPGTRAVPIDTLVLSSPELDACMGAITLRNGLSIRIASSRAARDQLLDQNAAFRKLEAVWSPFEWDRAFQLDRDGQLEARFFPLRGLPETEPRRDRAGIRITDRLTGTRLVWAPRIARFDSATLAELRQADIRFIDGTVYQEAEARQLSPGARFASDLGHIPVDGRDGSLALLSGMAGESFFVHMGGTNPLCDMKSQETERVRRAGVGLAFDGLELDR